MYDVCALGDALVDMFHGDGEDAFIANCGGTALNMIVCAARLGLRTSFISRIGADVMGDRVERALLENGVNIDGLIKDDQYFTTMTFVELNHGERSFSFARQFGADIMIRREDISRDIIRKSRLFHYSGMALMSEPSRSSVLELLEELRGEGKYICTDISYRESLWEDEATAIRVTREGLKYTDLVKCSDEEAFLISGKNTLPEAAEYFCGFGCRLCVITCGKDGAFWYMGGEYGTVEGFSVPVVDTTGAGDAFLGGFLYQLLKLASPNEVTPEMLPQMLRFANAVGALNITQKGGIDGAPTLEEVDRLLQA